MTAQKIFGILGKLPKRLSASKKKGGKHALAVVQETGSQRWQSLASSA